MAQIRIETAALAEGRVRYLEAGNGPTVLLLHGAGFLSGAESWLPVFPGLAEHFRLVAPDFLGWGASDQPEYPLAFGDLVGHVRELQDVLGIAPCHVIGHSMGGRVATLLGYESPARIRRLILVAPGGAALNPTPRPAGAWPAPSDEAVERFAAGLSDYGLDAGAIRDERLALAHDPVRVERFEAQMNAMMTAGSLAHFSTVRLLPHIHVPTMLLWGSADQTNPLELGERMHEHMLDSKLVVFDGAGHMLAAERTDEFNSAVMEFLS